MRNVILILSAVFVLLADINGASVEAEKGVIKIRVTDENGNGLYGAGAVISNSYLGGYTDSKGFYEFTGLKDGVYTITFSYLGYKSEVREVSLTGVAELGITLYPDIFTAPEVIVQATRAGNKTPVAQTSVNRALIERLNSGQDLPYILSLTPSLVETSEAGNGIGYTNMRIRGTDASRINVTIDGIPLNDPESQQVFWVDLPDLSSSVNNIQIQRGVGTSSNGSGAFGGTINIQTENPGSKPFAEISESAGSYNTFRTTASAGTGIIDEKVSFMMRYSDLKSDGYIDRAFSKNNSLFLTGVYYGAKSRLKANIILGRERTGISWNGITADLLETDRTYNSAGEYTDEEGNLRYYKDETDNYTQNHYQLFYNIDLGKSFTFNTAMHYTSGAGFYEQYKEDEALALYGLPVINSGGTIIESSDLVRRKWMRNDFYGIVYSLNYNGKKTEAVIGGGVNRYDGDHFGKVIWMRYAGNTETGYQWYLNRSVKDEFNIYSKVTHSLTEKLNLFGDLQYRYIHYTMTGSDDDVFLDQEHKYNFINPKAGLFYNINSNQDAYLSFAVANREPTRANFKDAAGDNKATPEPETMYDFEGGYNLRSGNISFGANIFYMLYNDQLVPTGELSNVGYPIMTNVPKSYRRGIELSFGARPVKDIAWNMNLTLSRNRINDFVEYYTDYNTSDWSSEYKSKAPSDVDISYSPSVTGSSDIIYTPFDKTEIHFISKYVGKQYFDNTQSAQRSLDPYFINNLQFNYTHALKTTGVLNLQLAVNNLFNSVYVNNGYGGNWYEDGVEKTWAYYFPQAGRNFMVNINLSF